MVRSRCSLLNVHARLSLTVCRDGVIPIDLPSAGSLLDLLAEVEFSLFQRQGVGAIGRHNLLEQAARFGDHLLGAGADVDFDLTKKIRPTSLRGADDEL